VHCHQGISRSTAASIGVLLQHGMTAQNAYNHVAKLRDILLPNGLIIRMLDEKFGLNGELVDLIFNERKIRMQKHLDQEANVNRHSDVLEMKSEKLKTYK
jgi:predicted protein tyrosine phosphatase